MPRLDQVGDLDTAKQMLAMAYKEIERLNDRIADLTRLLAAARGEGQSNELQLELSLVREQLAAFQRKLFGDSSEKRPSGKSKRGTSPKPKRGHGPREQPQLETQTVHLELPEGERACPACGEQMVPIEGLTEDSELITAVDRMYFKLLAMRQKYRCRCNGAMRTAPAATKVIEGGRYTLPFAVQIAIDKYVDHQPLERQVRAMARRGLVCDSQTLWDQLDALGTLLEPSYDALREYILGADVIGADETWWRLMQKKQSKKWWVWAVTCHDAAWYRVAPSRSAALAAEVLDGFEGTVLCDGYKAYETLERQCPGLRLAHCWAHARRNFVEAEPHYPKPCEEALGMIGELFAIEAQLPKADELEGDAKLTAVEVRKRTRRERSQPLLDKLRQWALTQRGLPKSGLRKAIDYMLRYWPGLVAFVDDPYLDIDNNRTERVLRGVCLGRKNHYGSRSERGTKVAAIFYSLVESAKLSGVEPGWYLRRAAEMAAASPGAVLLPHQLS